MYVHITVPIGVTLQKTSRKLDNMIFEDTHFSLTQNPFSGKSDFYGNGTCHVIKVSS